MNLTTLSGKFDALKTLGFQTPVGQILHTRAEVHAFFDAQAAARPTLGRAIDGLVFSIDDCAVVRDMGTEGPKQKPRGQIAAKFPADGAFVTITDIEWSQDGAEYICPVGKYAATMISGASCTNVGLKSPEWMAKHRIGVGSIVRVCRNGDVIPCINDDQPGWVREHSDDFRTPTHCAHCASPTEREGAMLRCTSEDCPAKQAAKIARFLDRNKVLGLGVQSLRAYTAAGVKLRDFFRPDARAHLTSLVASRPELSDAVWAKVAKQLWG